jgi:TolB-like protein
MNDPDQDYFVQGMHNALISELQRAGIAVIARTSVMQYENTQMPVSEIAGELGADALIESSVLRSGDNVEIEVRLVDAGTAQYLADPITRSSELSDVVALYRNLTSAIAGEIQAALSPQAEARLASARTVNPEAYEAYLKGQFHFSRLTPVDLEQALQYFDLALEIDPDYALAHAGRALFWIALNQGGAVPPSVAGPQARAAALRALELDSTLVEAQYAMALVKTWIDWDWPGGETAFRRAIDLNPSFPDVRAFYSHYLCAMKRPDEAMLQMERAVELDPFNPLLQGLHGQALFMLGRHDEALNVFQQLIRTVPDHPLGVGGLQNVYHAKGMHEEALAAANSYYTVLGLGEIEEMLTSAYAEGGYREAMRRAADAFAARRNVVYVLPVEIAIEYDLAGEDSLSLNWLERGFEEHDPGMPYLSVWPLSDEVRENPRFQALVQRMNLPF